MSANLSKQLKQTSTPSPWITFLVPMLLSLVISWGTANNVFGALLQRITTAENNISDQKEINKSFPTREETRIRDEAILRELNAIHQDVDAIRRALQK